MSEVIRPSVETELDTRLARYLSLGYSRERALGQLLLARFPLDLLRLRFPDLPESAFTLGLPPSVTPRSLRSLAPRPTAPMSRPPGNAEQNLREVLIVQL